MKQTIPVIINNDLFVAVGNGRQEYIVGKTILNSDSPEEKDLWIRTAKVCIIDELLQVCNFLNNNKIEEAKEIAYSINEFLTATFEEYPKCIENFKTSIEKIKV